MKDSAVRFKAYLLDWDGTLIHSLPLKIENAARLFESRYGVSFEAVKASYARHSGIPRRDLFDRIAQDCLGRTLDDDEFPELSAAFSEGNREILLEQGRLRPGTLPALEGLSKAGRLLFISTSAAQEEMEPLARHFGVAPYCNGLFGSRPGFEKGPDHAAFVKKTYDLKRKDMAGVGDDANDIHLFHKAGLTAIGITGTHPRETLLEEGADAVIDNLTELIR